MTSKYLAIALILFALVGLDLTAKGELLGAVQTLVSPPPVASTTSTITASQLAGAIAIYLIALSFMDQETGIAFTLIVVLSALLVDAKRNGKSALVALVQL